MTRKLGMMAGLLVLAACGEKGGADAGKPVTIPAETFVVGATEEIPETACGGTRIGEPLIMVITNQMLKQLSGPNQEILRDVSRDGKQVGAPTLNNKKLYPTNLDFPADGIGNPGDYVEIQIKLQPPKGVKRDLIFLRLNADAVPGDGNNSAGAVTVRKGDGTKFCGRKPIARDASTEWETLTFGSLLQKDEESSINIGILIKNNKRPGKSTPIYIDPNIRNKG